MFRLNFQFLFGHNTVLIICLGLGTKNTWLGSEKHHGLALNTCFDRHKKTQGDGPKLPHGLKL